MHRNWTPRLDPRGALGRQVIAYSAITKPLRVFEAPPSAPVRWEPVHQPQGTPREGLMRPRPQ